MNRRTVHHAFAFVAAVFLVAGCDKSPISPPPSGSNPSPLPARVTITGPPEMSPGTTAQFMATVWLSDGMTRDVTNEVRWTTSGPAVSISSSGLATARQPGEARVNALYGTTAAFQDVRIVMPAGTYKIAGRVTEAGSPNFGVARARVEVATGSASAPFTMTDVEGGYVLYGVSPGAELQVTKEGYETRVQRVDLSADASINIALTLAGVRRDMSGVYTLTITAAPECKAALPEEVHSRTYRAILWHDGSQLTAILEGATFFASPSHDTTRRYLYGVLNGDRPTFKLSSFGEETYADLIEQLSPSLFYIPSGTVDAAIGATEIAGPLNGVIGTWKLVTQFGMGVIASCQSTSHRFVLAR